MKNLDIKCLSTNFRQAIETARDNGDFSEDLCFDHFPRGCCGDTCYLLAEYLRTFAVESIYYSGTRDDWSHAWLIIKDRRVKKPTSREFSWPEELRVTLEGYGVEHPAQTNVITRYEEADLESGTIIDITGDQFSDYDIPVYVGEMDSFHQEFEFSFAHDYEGLNDVRLSRLYRKIVKYL